MNTRVEKCAEPRRYRIEFEVEGQTTFPLDMLRYDECFPVEETNALYSDERGRRRIRLRTFQPSKTWQPTVGRWESFLWAVVR